jgi:hypothetical protein
MDGVILESEPLHEAGSTPPAALARPRVQDFLSLGHWRDVNSHVFPRRPRHSSNFNTQARSGVLFHLPAKVSSVVLVLY